MVTAVRAGAADLAAEQAGDDRAEQRRQRDDQERCSSESIGRISPSA